MLNDKITLLLEEMATLERILYAAQKVESPAHKENAIQSALEASFEVSKALAGFRNCVHVRKEIRG